MAIHRAMWFSGMVLNPNNSIAVNKWKPLENYDFTHTPANPQDVLNEFKVFTYNNALRELMESFDIIIINIFKLLYIMNNFADNVDGKLTEKETRNFKRKNFYDKLKQLDSLLNNKLSQQKTYWQALQDIRNCITHCSSTVDKPEIPLNLPVFKIILKTANNETELPIGVNANGFKATDDSVIRIEFQTITKVFKKGERILFTAHEITFLILAMQKSLDFLRKIILEKYLSNFEPEKDSFGIEINILKNDKF